MIERKQWSLDIIPSSRILSRMQESIIPWDGMNGDAPFLQLIDQSGTGLVLIKGSFSAQPYSCMLDSRNDTWFSLDRVVVYKRSEETYSMCSDGSTDTNSINKGLREPLFLSRRTRSFSESSRESTASGNSVGSDPKEPMDVKGVAQKHLWNVPLIL